VEGTLGPIEVLKGWRQAEVIKYTTDCHQIGYTTAMFVVMNLSVWESLRPEIQSVFEATSRKWIDVHGQRWDQVDQECLTYTIGLGNEVVHLGEEEINRWKQKVRPIIDAYTTQARKQNLDGGAYVQMLTRAIESR
jgi:TRAP-type C4-dicarboxylate transport system substrate-binding protein